MTEMVRHVGAVRRELVGHHRDHRPLPLLQRDCVGDRERRAGPAGAEAHDAEVDGVGELSDVAAVRGTGLARPGRGSRRSRHRRHRRPGSRSSQSAAMSRQERQAASVRIPARRPGDGPATRKVGAATSTAGGAVGVRIQTRAHAPSLEIHAHACNLVLGVAPTSQFVPCSAPGAPAVHTLLGDQPEDPPHARRRRRNARHAGQGAHRPGGRRGPEARALPASGSRSTSGRPPDGHVDARRAARARHPDRRLQRWPLRQPGHVRDRAAGHPEGGGAADHRPDGLLRSRCLDLPRRGLARARPEGCPCRPRDVDGQVLAHRREDLRRHH